MHPAHHHKTQGANNLSMHQSNPSNPSSTRPTLKLKVAASSSSDRAPRAVTPNQRRGSDSPCKNSGETPSPSLPHPPANPARQQSKVGQKPGAAWSDELKQRMQKDMDALLTR
jgi:hypothetical protein